MNDTKLIDLINGFAGDYGMEAVLEIFFGEASVGEVFADMWNAGLIPVDKMEAFLLDD